MSRRLKQFIYGVAFFIFLVLIACGVYFTFLKPAQSCFDNIKNQNEEGIDCGGVCGNSCIPSDIKEIEISQQRIFRLNSNHFSLFAEIKNPNTDFAAANFTYTLNAYNEKGELIQSESGTSFLYSKETGYLLAPNLESSSSYPSRLEVIIGKIDWKKSEDFKKPEIAVGDFSFTTETDQINVGGSLINKSISSFPAVKVIAIFYNTQGQLIGASATEFQNLPANTSQTFFISHPAIKGINYSSTRFFSRIISQSIN